MSDKMLEEMLLGATGEGLRSEFYMFEVWDVEERSEVQREHIIKDKVQDRIDSYGEDPHPFQSGIIYEYPRIGAIFAGTQTGKTYPVMIDAIIQCTGELPYSMRYDKGVDTGVDRLVDEKNIIRWGRFDKESGEFLDHNVDAEDDGTWNCGTIKGTGVYPRKKMLKAGEVIWIGTFRQAMEENWWPSLKALIPEHTLDFSQGSNGFAERDKNVFFRTGVELHFITYEQRYAAFESVTVDRIILDEEPPDEKIWGSALSHCKHITLVETPYRGMTFTYKKIRLAAEKDDTIRFYHCTQYDSPYQTEANIKSLRLTWPKWEIEARVYGLHSEQAGKPYFHDLYGSLQKWYKNFNQVGNRVNLLPETAYCSPRDLAMQTIRSEADEDGIWEVYEHPRPDSAYFLSCDTARGDDNEDERVDANVAHIFRLDDEVNWPIEVACCRTTRETKYFARECLLASAWYNNCIMAPESKGFSAGTFINEIHGWPFLYTMTVKDDRTNKAVERIGFNTNVKTRQQIFDEIGDFLRDHSGDTISPFKSKSTLKEIFELVTGKNGRPDHPKNGTSDSVISFGIGLYVFMFDKMQIRNNISFRRRATDSMEELFGGRFNVASRETRPVLGSKRGLDVRATRQRSRSR